MIELKDIEFSYSRKGAPALSGVTAIIPPGIHLLAGENGAGKTTLLHIIAGIIRPDRGECLIDGTPSHSSLPSEIGRVFLLEENMYFPAKTIKQFAARHSQFYPGFSQETFESNLKAFGQTGDESLRNMSLGNRKKAQLAYALSLGTEILLFDEPTNAIDIQSRETLRRLIARCIGDNQTVIISTHSVNDLENLFDGAVMLTRSRLLFAGTEEGVTERLAFEITRAPLEDALYTEIQVGRVLNILPALTDDEPTRVDWRLLYSGLHSPRRDNIINQLLTTPQNDVNRNPTD